MPRGIPNKKPEQPANMAATDYLSQVTDYLSQVNQASMGLNNAAAFQGVQTGGVAVPVLPPVEAYDPYAPRHVPEPEPEGPKMARVKLDRHYSPINAFSVVGHTRPEIKKKNAIGLDEIFQTEEWIAGEMMPPAIAGTGFKNKVWAGTVIELPETEAKTIVKQKIGSLEFAD